MGLHSVKADEKQMESTADGALDPWSCLFCCRQCYFTTFIFYMESYIYISILDQTLNAYYMVNIVVLVDIMILMDIAA